MKEIQEDAQKYRAEAHFREIAHDISAEYHRKRGVRFGLITTVLSSIVGTAVFIAATKFVVSDKGVLLEPTETLSPALFYTIVGISILAPVLSACQQYLKDPDETEKHQFGVRHYSNVTVRLDAFLRTLSSKEHDAASNELAEISKAMMNPTHELPSLTETAKTEARARIAEDEAAQ